MFSRVSAACGALTPCSRTFMDEPPQKSGGAEVRGEYVMKSTRSEETRMSVLDDYLMDPKISILAKSLTRNGKDCAIPFHGLRRNPVVAALPAKVPYRAHSRRSASAPGTAPCVKGFRTPASQWRDEMLGGRRPKSLRGGNRGGVCAGSGVGLWRFSLCMPRSLDIERGSRPSHHRGVGFDRRVQDRNGGLVVSDLRFGGRRRD